MRHAFAGLLLGTLTLVIRTGTAAACSCPTGAIQVIPGPRELAPLNVHVRILVSPSLADTKDDATPLKLQTFVLRKARAVAVQAKGKRGGTVAIPPQDVATRRTDLGLATTPVVELIPESDLLPHARYEVVFLRKDGKADVVGAFTTADAADHSPPAWTGVKSCEYLAAPETTNTCGTGEPQFRLDLEPASDDQTSGPALLYAVWLPAADGSIAYDAPPTTYVRAESDRIVLGQPWRCTGRNFELPPPGTTLRIGLVATDLAGNASPTREVILNADPK
jgi:hypothetical protein